MKNFCNEIICFKKVFSKLTNQTTDVRKPLYNAQCVCKKLYTAVIAVVTYVFQPVKRCVTIFFYLSYNFNRPMFCEIFTMCYEDHNAIYWKNVFETKSFETIKWKSKIDWNQIKCCWFTNVDMTGLEHRSASFCAMAQNIHRNTWISLDKTFAVKLVQMWKIWRDNKRFFFKYSIETTICSESKVKSVLFFVFDFSAPDINSKVFENLKKRRMSKTIADGFQRQSSSHHWDLWIRLCSLYSNRD